MKKLFKIITLLFLLSQLSSTAQLHAYSFTQFKQAVQRTWFCYRNPQLCTPQEHAAAKRWVYGVGGAAVAATLVAGGLPLWRLYQKSSPKRQPQKEKEMPGAGEGIKEVKEKEMVPESSESAPGSLRTMKEQLSAMDDTLNDFARDTAQKLEEIDVYRQQLGELNDVLDQLGKEEKQVEEEEEEQIRTLPKLPIEEQQKLLSRLDAIKEEKLKVSQRMNELGNEIKQLLEQKKRPQKLKQRPRIPSGFYNPS